MNDGDLLAWLMNKQGFVKAREKLSVECATFRNGYQYSPNAELTARAKGDLVREGRCIAPHITVAAPRAVARTVMEQVMASVRGTVSRMAHTNIVVYPS